MGRTVYDRKYNVFNEGDEVYTTKPNWRAITANKPYIVLKCYKPAGFIDNYPGMVLEVMSDGGYVSKYATDKFFKTDAQIRQDKIDAILKNNI